jgi:hypothetical protein
LSSLLPTSTLLWPLLVFVLISNIEGTIVISAD